MKSTRYCKQAAKTGYLLQWKSVSVMAVRDFPCMATGYWQVAAA
jgi:hypothetical protein